MSADIGTLRGFGKVSISDDTINRSIFTVSIV